MATTYKIAKFAISTEHDLEDLEQFLSLVSKVSFIVNNNGCILVIYEE